MHVLFYVETDHQHAYALYMKCCLKINNYKYGHGV